MPYIKKKDVKLLLQLLDTIECPYNWTKIERNNNSWGDCSVHEDDHLKIDKRWSEVARSLKRELKG